MVGEVSKYAKRKPTPARLLQPQLDGKAIRKKRQDMSVALVGKGT